MKRILLLSALFLAVALGDAMAICSGTKVTDIKTALEGKLVCAKATAAHPNPGDTWTEEHKTIAGGTGPLIEFAKGPGDPVDPEKQVGTWAVTTGRDGSPAVVYKYGFPIPNSALTYVWTLFFQSGSSYLFCTTDGNTAIATAAITNLPVNAANPCPARQ
jgi:hypothetical protein